MCTYLCGYSYTVPVLKRITTICFPVFGGNVKPLARILISAVAVLMASAVTTAGFADQALTFKVADDLPIVSYTQRHDRVRGVDRPAGLVIYADGRVNVHRSSFMTEPGDWEYQLTAKQLHVLLLQFSANGLLEFDEKVVKAQLEAARQVSRNAGVRYAVGDSTYSDIEVRLASFSIDGAKPQAVDTKLTWANISADARRFGGVEGLQGLAAAERSLQQLMNPKYRGARLVKGVK